MKKNKYDFYRIEVLTNSVVRDDLVDYLKEKNFKYVEDSSYGGSIFIFKVPFEDRLRKEVLNLWGRENYFSMEGNLSEEESYLSRYLN